MLVSEVGLLDVKRLYDKYKDALSEHFQHQLLPPNNVNPDLIPWMLLIDIQDRLEVLGRPELFQEIGNVIDNMRIAVSAAKKER